MAANVRLGNAKAPLIETTTTDRSGPLSTPGVGPRVLRDTAAVHIAQPTMSTKKIAQYLGR